MAKIYGLFGSMTGKVADVVMAVRNGEQIARKYQPVVSNPNTIGQIQTRAKLKMMSQLSAILAPVIAIPRQGVVSSRNLFTKLNYPNATYSEDVASINLASLKITSSVVAFPNVSIERGETNTSIALLNNDPLDVDRVVYCVFVKQNDELRFITSRVVSTPGTENDYAISMAKYSAGMLVLAYGVRDNNENAHATFGNLEAPSAQSIAKLIVSRQLLEADVTLTETKGAELAPVA